MAEKPEVVVDVETAAAKLPDGVIDLNALTTNLQKMLSRLLANDSARVKRARDNKPGN